MWGARLAMPLAGSGWTATIDDVRALVLAVHIRLNVGHPRDEYLLNLLGTALLIGRLPKRLAHLKGRVVILGSYKIRQPHVAAANEIEQRGVRDCADVFAADEAKREHEGLKAKAAARQQLSDGASGSGTTRERSRSPRHAQDLPTSHAA